MFFPILGADASILQAYYGVRPGVKPQLQRRLAHLFPSKVVESTDNTPDDDKQNISEEEKGESV